MFSTSARKARSARYTVPDLYPAKGRALKALDIEAALRWAYCEEIPKRQRASADTMIVQMMALGTPIDHTRSMPAVETGDPHPDAVTLDQAVRELEAIRGDLLDETIGYLNDYSGFGLSEDHYLSLATRDLPVLIGSCAKRHARPLLGEIPHAGPWRGSNGNIVCRRREIQSYQDVTGVTRQHLVDASVKRISPGVWPDGSYCPVLWDQTIESLAASRAEWIIWVLALRQLADLDLPLKAMRLTEPPIPLMPWRET